VKCDAPCDMFLDARHDCVGRVVTLLVDGEGGSSAVEEGGAGSVSVPDLSQWQRRLCMWAGEGGGVCPEVEMKHLQIDAGVPVHEGGQHGFCDGGGRDDDEEEEEEEEGEEEEEEDGDCGESAEGDESEVDICIEHEHEQPVGAAAAAAAAATKPPPTCAASSVALPPPHIVRFAVPDSAHDMPPPARSGLHRLKLTRDKQLPQPRPVVPETPPAPLQQQCGCATPQPAMPPAVQPATCIVSETPPQSQAAAAAAAAAAASPECSQIYVRRRRSSQLTPLPPPRPSQFSPSSPALPIRGRGGRSARLPVAAVLSPDTPVDAGGGGAKRRRRVKAAADAVVCVSSSISSACSSSWWEDECGVCGMEGGQLLCCEAGGCSKVFHKACIGCVD
jgi:hypothetical protein